jgi:mono/diheme cytochrome c family protein
MMNSRIVPFIIGVVTTCGLPVILLALATGLGILPVQADVAPSSLESSVLRAALHASVARHAPRGGNPQPSPETDSTSGAAIYRQLCSRCHGLTAQSDNTYGKSFYPPAPHLLAHGTTFTEGEVFWIVKHGIRNTAMPGWSNLLSDDDIWKVAGMVQKINSSRENP